MEIQVVVAERKKHVDLMKERPNGKRKQKVYSGQNDVLDSDTYYNLAPSFGNVQSNSICKITN